MGDQAMREPDRTPAYEQFARLYEGYAANERLMGRVEIAEEAERLAQEFRHRLNALVDAHRPLSMETE